jgi:hypothetical protein
MITTFLTERGRLPWPYLSSYPLEGNNKEIDTELEKNLRPWFVPGDTPPPEICDLLSASDYTFEFSFNSAVFNQRFDLLDENGEGGFPKDISFSRSIKAGTWLSKTKSEYGRASFGEGDDIEETYNEEFAWNTRSKVLEAYSDSIPVGFGGFAGLAYTELIELVYTDENSDISSSAGYWAFSVAMSAQLPYKTFNLKKELVWTCSLPFIAGISRIDFGSFAPLGGQASIRTTTSYPYLLEGDKNYPIGSTYIDIKNFGGQGEGQGGMFPSASISIKNHF